MDGSVTLREVLGPEKKYLYQEYNTSVSKIKN